ncbi:venom protease-like [Condylostylus longicornis]|uniref:venom protease-like n=1 Tax=Condylostylus longicornis TaxID=2530218 RepID=UPI00244E4D5F|nr:venom protease-like [Condylostylus longicornis]
MKCHPSQFILENNSTRPIICRFANREAYVCCRSIIPKNFIDESWRISEKKCEQFHPLPPPFEILSGYETEPDEFPFMAVIGYGNASNPVYNCGGVLVEKNFVLTAGHCGKYNGEPASVVRIGGNPLSDNATKPIRVVKVIIHPNYDSITELNDIAILALGQHVDATPACLNIFGKLETEYSKKVIAMGYGSTSFGGAFAKRLLKIFLTVVDNSVCEKDYEGQQIVDTQLCVKGNIRQLNETETGIQDTCQGDSGGPLLLKQSLRVKPSVVGIVSYGRGCGTEIPGIYTNVTAYLDWIESVICIKKELKEMDNELSGKNLDNDIKRKGHWTMN